MNQMSPIQFFFFWFNDWT